MHRTCTWSIRSSGIDAGLCRSPQSGNCLIWAFDVGVPLPLVEYHLNIWHDRLELLGVLSEHRLALLKIATELCIFLQQLLMRCAKHHCWWRGLALQALQLLIHLLHLQLLCLQLRTQEAVVLQQGGIHLTAAFQLLDAHQQFRKLLAISHCTAALLDKLLLEFSTGMLRVLEPFLQQCVT